MVGVFEESGLEYRPTNLVLFNGFTQSECGGAQAQSGPHYCPIDEFVYTDLDFLAELQRRLAPPVTPPRPTSSPTRSATTSSTSWASPNRCRARAPMKSVALEPRPTACRCSALHPEESAALLESGDLEEALNAAAAVGDDAIQQQTTGQVNPETWTHGSSEQRYQWLNQGFTSGPPAAATHSPAPPKWRSPTFGSVPLGPIYRYRGMMSG